MHSGLVADRGRRSRRAHRVRIAAIVHPLLMSAATIATGNHHLLDCSAGAVIGLGALAAAVPARSRAGTQTAPGMAGRHG
jgi:membrane-associated phospholipid phosphatase